jgi:hypothetical protein
MAKVTIWLCSVSAIMFLPMAASVLRGTMTREEAIIGSIWMFGGILSTLVAFRREILGGDRHE